MAAAHRGGGGIQVDDEVNWLTAERVACPACHQALYRVDHSPLYDEVFLYCDRCPIHVEVSYYDPVYDDVARAQPSGKAFKAFMRALEARLKPCSCGGAFRHDAARRCLACHAPVIVDDPAAVDLFFGLTCSFPTPRTPTMRWHRSTGGVMRPSCAPRICGGMLERHRFGCSMWLAGSCAGDCALRC